MPVFDPMKFSIYFVWVLNMCPCKCSFLVAEYWQ